MVQVLLKLGCVLGAAIFVSRTLLPMLLRILARHASKELQQLSLVGFCLMSAWISGWLGLSEELGAFIAGGGLKHLQHLKHGACRLVLE